MWSSNALNIYFGIHVPQDMESEEDTVYYHTTYNNDTYIPELKSVGREKK